MIREERWLPVKGYEGLYLISERGNVRSLTVLRNHGGYRPRVIPGKLLSATRAKEAKYRCVTLYNLEGESKKYRVFGLVARHFIPNPNNLPLVRHLDDNPTNDKYTNLAWGTKSDNAKDAAKNGLLGHKLTAVIVKRIREDLRARAKQKRRKNGGQFSFIARKYKLSISTVRQIHFGKRWSHVN